MLSFRAVTPVLLVTLTLTSCRRDPAVAKKEYVESGNKYLARGRFKEAVIQYQNAAKIDPRYGPAHYKLGGVYLKLKPPSVALSIKEFRNAVELLKENEAYQEEYKDSIVQLAQLELVFLSKDKQTMEDVQGYCEELLKKDPNSFDGFRLTGNFDFTRAGQEADPTVAATLLDSAMDNYRKAEAIKPGDPGVALQMGLILRGQKRYAEAEPYFRKMIDKDKTAYPAYMDLYQTYMAEQKVDAAEALLKEAVQNNPKDHQYLERLAYHYGALGRRDDMLNVLTQIKAHAKDFDAVNQVVGDFYLRIGDAESALREYREGIVKDAKRKSTYQHSIIFVLLNQGKRAEAAEVNNQILKENPKDPDAQSLAATFLLDQGDVNTALTQLQAVVTTAPDNAVAHYQLGRAYLASRRIDAREAARQQFEKAISLRPDMISPRLGLAQLQVSHGEYEAGLDSVQQILKRDPNNVHAKLIQSQAYLGEKKFGDSDKLVDGILKSNPSRPDVYFQAGIAALTEGKPRDAEADFMRAYELNPASPKSLLGVVDSEIQEGEPEKAMAFLQREAVKSPNRLDIPILLGTTAQREGKFDESLVYFNRVLNGLDKKSKTRADLYVQIAYTYRRKGDLDNTIANLEKARDILPENETVLADLGVVSDLAGRLPEARKAYEACLKVNPNNAMILNNLAYLMAQTGSDLQEALNYAQQAKGLQPNLPDISDTVGWIMLKRGLPAQAIPVFKDLVAQQPANALFHYHLAKAYSMGGDASNAAGELREALKHNPKKEEQKEIQDMMAQLAIK